MGFAVEGYQTVAQNFISRSIASNFYSKSALLAILGALTIGNQAKSSLEIGRPKSGEILSGKALSPAERMNLQGINEYQPRIQLFKTSNTTARTDKGLTTAPTVANATTNAHSQVGQAAAAFRWTHLDTPILVWQEDEIRAGQKETREGQGLAMSQVLDEATEVGMQDLIDTVATDAWTGNPTSQDAQLWDHQPGLAQMFDTANIYGRVDRSDPTCAAWKGQKDTTFKKVDIGALIDDANITKGIRVKGNGVNCVLCHQDLYMVYKAQVLARGGVTLKDGLPEFAKMGVKKEALQVDNAVVMYDAGCPANTAVAMDLSVVKFIVNPMFNFKVTDFGDLWKHQEAGKWARQAYVQLRYMLTNDNPWLGVRYTAIGTA